MAKDLAARTAAQAANTTEKPTVSQLIERMKPEIGRALPKHMDPDRLARIALTVFRQTPQLSRCDPQSFLGALMTCSQLGLEPGPLGEAYLVPYGNQVQFIPGYKGLIKLAWQSSQMKHIDAHEVCANDAFDYAYGLEPFLYHKPARRNRGEITDVYACATLLNGGSAFVVMSIEDVEKIRARSKSGKNGPWTTDWTAMAKKTAIKQLAKFLPMSTELREFAAASEMDGTLRKDVSHLIEEQVPEYVDPSGSDTTVDAEYVEHADDEPSYTPDPEQDPWNAADGGDQS